MKLSERAAKDIGWDDLLRHLAAKCQSAPGRDDCLALPFLDDRAAIEQELAAVREAQDVLARRERPSLGDVIDAGPDLDRAVKGGTLPPGALLGIARLAACSNLTRGFMMRRRDHYPAMAARYGAIERVEDLGEEIRRVLDDQGQVRDGASPVLQDLRAQMLRLREAIIGRIKEMMAQPLFADMMQDAYYTVRNGRYVLPIKVGFKNQVKGIIHGASQTGATLFVEPESLVEPGNEIMICESRIDDEVQRILGGLSRLAAGAAAVLLANLASLRGLDVLFAKAEIAGVLNASVPAIGGRMALEGARHPLLSLRQAAVVSNDVALPDGCRGLLISGPNAGGKTVLLKTVGLCAAMTAAAVPPPVMPGSTVPLYDEVFTVFGDAQDLAGDLSSFSGHLVQINRIVESAGASSLVLLDEIASDTDPREGAALAAAVIEGLSARGAAVFATSHFHELREWVAGRGDAGSPAPGGVLNASMGFDLLRLRPSFRLEIGVAGESFALRIASNLGLPRALLDRARELLGRAYVEGEKVLERLKKKEEDLDAAIAAAREREERAALEYEARRAAIEKDLAQARDECRQERERLLAEFGGLREKAAAEVARIQKSGEMKTAVDTQKWLADVVRGIEGKKTAPRPGRAPSPGDRVVIGTLGTTGTVERIDYGRREAAVTAGGKRITVPVSSLTLADAPAPAPRPAASGDGLLKAIEKGRAAQDEVEECDLRGLYAEEAVAELDLFLDRAYRDDLAQARVIHGLGTGALRNAVRDHLKASPYVRSFRPGEPREGGDGVTVVVLKKE